MCLYMTCSLCIGASSVWRKQSFRKQCRSDRYRCWKITSLIGEKQNQMNSSIFAFVCHRVRFKIGTLHLNFKYSSHFKIFLSEMQDKFALVQRRCNHCLTLNMVIRRKTASSKSINVWKSSFIDTFLEKINRQTAIRSRLCLSYWFATNQATLLAIVLKFPDCIQSLVCFDVIWYISVLQRL